MEILIKDHGLTVSVSLDRGDGEGPTCEEVLLAAYDVISRVFTQEAVILAYYRTDPDTMALREPCGEG